jgi:CheY-like chemotaxis protein
MTDKHRALIVEDEPEAAADLRDILEQCGCESVIASNRRDALAELTGGTFCVILLDLQIKADPYSIRGHSDHGRSFLREARGRHPQLVGTKHALPIVVLSGFASEREEAIDVMRDGASDVIQKLSCLDQKVDRIQKALDGSGRTSHRACEERVELVLDSSENGLILSIPGEQSGRRVLVRLGRRDARLTHGALKVLLHLVIARLSNSTVSKHKLGARDDRSFRAVSGLRSELAQAYDGDPKGLVTNDQQGNYCLAENVTIGSVDTDKLKNIREHQITKLAQEISNCNR